MACSEQGDLVSRSDWTEQRGKIQFNVVAAQLVKGLNGNPPKRGSIRRAILNMVPLSPKGM